MNYGEAVQRAIFPNLQFAFCGQHSTLRAMAGLTFRTRTERRALYGDGNT